MGSFCSNLIVHDRSVEAVEVVVTALGAGPLGLPATGVNQGLRYRREAPADVVALGLIAVGDV